MSVFDQLNPAAKFSSNRDLLFKSERLKTAAIPISTVVGLLVIWELSVIAFSIPQYIAPAPSDVVSTFGAKFPLLMQNFWPTFFESVLGFIFGNLAAILIAIAFVHYRLVERAFFPLAVFINTIPILAIAPILVLIFGAGLTAKVVIAGLICFFPTLVNMVRGLSVRHVSHRTSHFSAMVTMANRQTDSPDDMNTVA